MMRPDMPRRSELEKLEIETAADLAKRKRGTRKRVAEKQRRKRVGQRVTKRAKKRRHDPTPPGSELPVEKIKEMDPEDPQFRSPRGRPRKDHTKGTWKDGARADNTKRKRARRAKGRKVEALTVAAGRELDLTGGGGPGDVEARVYASGELDMDDWDDEELIRGYRRNRYGNFGKAPALVPREVQQEAFRRLLRRGSRKLSAAYLEALNALVELAHSAESEKVKLEAIKEIQNRVAGKVADVVHIGEEKPWEGMLADSIDAIPVTEMVPIDIPFEVESVEDETGGGVELPKPQRRRRSPSDGAPSSPDSKKKKKK